MELTPEDFAYIARYLRDQSAIHLEPGKEYLVETRLFPLVRELGHDSFTAFFNWIKANPHSHIGQRVVDAMTTNETLFFRDFHPFETLRRHLLPQLITKKESTKTLHFWSAACSSGQEAYSLNMILREHFSNLNIWKVQILATDLSTTILEAAKAGRYSQLEVNRGLPAAYMLKYFKQEQDQWCVAPSVRERIEFRLMNLVSPWVSLPPMDIIFLRNVLIYFQPDVKKLLLERAYQQLNPGGYLLLGGSENIHGLSDRFRSHLFDKTIVYEKP
jgi:chemotaxis protein methyltransferase CheR